MASTPRRAPAHALIGGSRCWRAPPIAAAAVLRVGAEFQVNTYTPDYQFYSSVAADADGDFVVVWSSRYQDGEAYGVFGQRFDSAGTPLGSELAVSTYTSNTQHKPAVAAARNGDFVVIWQSYLQDGAGYGVFAQRYSSDGSRQGAEFQVNDDVVFHEYAAAVAVDADGDFVVVWQSNGGGRQLRRRLRAPLRLRGRGAGGRVPGQRLHRPLAEQAGGRRRAERRLRRGLGELEPG